MYWFRFLFILVIFLNLAGLSEASDKRYTIKSGIVKFNISGNQEGT